MVEHDCDALVIGAGPAGSAAGIELARAGFKVIAVDRARFPRPKTCGDALSFNAVRIATELGAAVDATSHAVVRGAAAVFPDGHRVLCAYGDEPGRIIGRLDLDARLRDALEAAGATVMESVNIRSVLVEDGRARGASSDELRFRAKVVIAADGPGSVAWNALHDPYPREAALAVSATAYFEDVGPSPSPGFTEHCFERELPCGYGWIFPAVEGVTNVGVYQRADAYKSAKVPLAKLFEGFVARHADRFARARRVGPVHSWALPLAGVRKRPEIAALLQVGDAGRYVDPFTGEGIWQALFTGRLAGRVAAEGLRAGDVDLARVRRFRRECALRLDLPSSVRSHVAEAMDVVVGRELYRYGAVRAVLEWGFNRQRGARVRAAPVRLS